jgi:phage baseplate assembly protein W
MITPAISFPFTIDASGSVALADTEAKVWADRVLAVIGTVKGVRVYRPSFGCDINYALFEVLEDINGGIEEAVAEAFDKHLPLLTFVGLEVTPSYDETTANLTLYYDLPNELAASVEVGIAYISNTSPLYEEF